MSGNLLKPASGDGRRPVFNSGQLARRILPREEAAVKDQGLASHERCAVRTHPYHRVGDFRWSSEAAYGMTTQNVFVDLWNAKDSPSHGRFRKPGTYSVDTNSAFGVLKRSSFGQPDHA